MSDDPIVALDQIKTYVEAIIADPWLDGIVLSDQKLDALCLAMGKKISIDISLAQVAKEQSKNTVLYIATELYLSGGHTAVLEDFIKAQPECEHVIVLTDLFNASPAAKKAIHERFSVLSIKLVWCPEKVVDLIEKVRWLQQQWIQINPSKIFLFNHHQDVVAIAAAQPEMPGKLFFFHHADYQITLGMHLPHATHIDFYQVLYKRCREEFGITTNVYYPLVVADNGCKIVDSFMQEGVLHTCSSGSMGKYDKSYLYSYFDLLPKILKATNGRHTHIGYLSDELLEKINNFLLRNDINQDKFHYVPWVSNLWAFLLKQQVDLYIASFPIGGGRAAVEVMGAGIPIVFHNNYRAPFLGGAIQYPDALFWRTEAELLAFLSSIKKDVLITQSKAARKCYEMHHQATLLAKAFISSHIDDAYCSSALAEAKVDKDLLLADLLSGAIEKDLRVLKLNKQIECLAKERDHLPSIFRLFLRWIAKFFLKYVSVKSKS